MTEERIINFAMFALAIGIFGAALIVGSIIGYAIESAWKRWKK
jgi:hypothetical protein